MMISTHVTLAFVSPEIAPVIALYTADPALRVHVARQLTAQNIALDYVPHPATSTRPWSTRLADVFIVDICGSLQMPACFVRKIRLLAGARPIIALIPGDDMVMRVLALDHGADDAVHMHCDGLELAARISALLRRHANAAHVLRCGDLSIDRQGRHVVRNGQHIALPAREYELLVTLASTPNQPVSHENLLRILWRLDFDPGTNRVAVHMSRLRSRVDTGFGWKLLHTIKGIGYCLRTRHAPA